MNKNKWYIKLSLSVLTGLLLSFAWYVRGAAIIIMLAFVPLFWLSDISLKEGKRNAFGRGILLFYPAFFVFNLITTYWIAYCTLPGAAAAVILNALLQTLVFAAWHACRKQVQNHILQAVMLISFMVAFEYLHLNWDLTWPWLVLGNVFAQTPGLVQWYSITGTLGGTVWILLCNFLVYWEPLTKREREKRPRKYGSILTICCLVLPMLISLLMYELAERKIDRSIPIEAVIVQQNTDPWVEEYSLTNEQEVQRLLEVAGSNIDEKTNLVITPESAIAHSIEMSTLRQHSFLEGDTRYEGFALLDSVTGRYPNVNFVLGLSTIGIYDHKVSPVSQEVAPDKFVEWYNTAGFYNKNGLVNYYHKSRLVPGVEKMPFPKVFGFLGKVLIELGGSNSSLGTDTAQRTFAFDVDGRTLRVGTGICYESVYGELMGRFVKNGANILSVITNDSWWDDSPGHRQHFDMSRLRAIETRRYVLRAANGGFSGVINPLGDVLEKTNYNERTALHAKVYAQDRMTFYAKHGDYLAVIAIFFAIFGILYALSVPVFRKLRH
ncbi:MAG: apolipoprotein N-acyltransferase [Bacteroidales bacterium]|nr:apolipoprotein N-acyltransferase [Bacteroidales bacterium]